MAAVVVFKPTADRKFGTQDLAWRTPTLDGKTVGLLFNAKVNADVYLERIKELIDEKFSNVKFVYRSKPTASKPMEPEVFEALSRCNVVVNAFGD